MFSHISEYMYSITGNASNCFIFEKGEINDLFVLFVKQDAFAIAKYSVFFFSNVFVGFWCNIWIYIVATLWIEAAS